MRPDVPRAIVVTSLAWFLIFLLMLSFNMDNSSTEKHRNVIRGERSIATQKTDDLVDSPFMEEVITQRSNEEEHVAPFMEQEEVVTLLSQPHKEDVDPKAQEELEKLLAETSFTYDGPGYNGKGVTIDKSKEDEMKKMFKENQFNLMASNLISVNRTLPDYRSWKCQSDAKAIPVKDLPPASIIIVFHNEAWTTLLRGLHSIIYRSPRHLLKEIILVDDFSDRAYLKEPLDLFVKRLPVQIRILHLPKRSGLIRARLAGSDIAEGKVLVFLDAHIEASEGWLEPLLYEVHQDHKRVVSPTIDIISDDSFEYLAGSGSMWGGFNWHLQFRWYSVPERENARRNHDKGAPIRTPTIAGGLFAIDRQFFYDIGSYDKEMQVWGGENIEISFRVWMCGGILEIHPCSKVGHVFRKQSPYTFPGGSANVIHRNSARTAEVWMDEYKEFFYSAVPGAKKINIGDLSERRKLRETLQCKSFQWYLDNIYPESPVPGNYLSIGAISNPSTNLCFDTMGHKAGEAVGAFHCHGTGGNQVWSFTKSGQIRTDETCIAASRNSLLLEKCSITPGSNQIFSYDQETKLISHVHSSKCVVADGKNLILEECESEKQQLNDGNKFVWNIANFKSS